MCWLLLGYMTLNLDMSKAYDKMKWDFLERKMLHLGFSGRFVATIMSCIKSVSYSVLLNGVPSSTIRLSKGLQQGDPLAPYLFLVCAMGLQGLLHKAEADGSLRGVLMCRNGPVSFICSLQMTVCSFVKQRNQNVR